MTRLEAHVEGRTCDGCARHVREAFERAGAARVEVDEILVATGRTPNTGRLGLERAGVKTDDDGHILVDAEQRTNVPGVFAVGDCTQQPAYVYVARPAAPPPSRTPSARVGAGSTSTPCP